MSRERLGSKADGMNAIKTHQWFAGFDWGGLKAGEYFHQVRHAAESPSQFFPKRSTPESPLFGRQKVLMTVEKRGFDRRRGSASMCA